MKVRKADMQHASGKWIQTRRLLEHVTEKDHLGYLDVDGEIVKRILKKYVWAGGVE